MEIPDFNSDPVFWHPAATGSQLVAVGLVDFGDQTMGTQNPQLMDHPAGSAMGFVLVPRV